jgi:acyl carrier protein
MLVRHSTAKETLANRAGVEVILARTALNLMGEALSLSDPSADKAVLVIGEINWTLARSHLPLLESPSFDDLIRETDVAEADAQQKIDVGNIVATRSPGEALKLIADVIVHEIAHILRLPQDTLSRTKPLAEIGLDSLMAAELGVRLEERLTLEAPLSASAGSFNVVDLADHILGLCVSGANREDGAPAQDSAARDLAARHLGAGIDAAALAPLAALVEEKSRDLTKILQ